MLLQVVGLGDPEVPAALVHAPLTLAPVPFPREAFQRAKRAATVRTNTRFPFIVSACTACRALHVGKLFLCGIGGCSK